MSEIYETATAAANVYVAVYDLAGIVDRIPGLSGEERLQVFDTLEPIHESWASNTTTIGLDEYRALNSDASRDVDNKPVEVALGDDSTPPAYDNRALNNELGRTSIDEYSVDGTSIALNASLASHQITDDGSGNYPELTELAVVDDVGRYWNHSLFSSFENTGERGAQFEITFHFDTA